MKYIKLFEHFKDKENDKIIFTRYGKIKGDFGNWGSSNSEEFKHLHSIKSEFSFNKNDKIKTYQVVEGSKCSLVSYEDFGNDQDFEKLDKLNELDANYEFELITDAITAIGAKEQGYDGLIFNIEEENCQYALDLRQHTLEDLKQNFNKLLEIYYAEAEQKMDKYKNIK
jgi:hypothetical protein